MLGRTTKKHRTELPFICKIWYSSNNNGHWIGNQMIMLQLENYMDCLQAIYGDELETGFDMMVTIWYYLPPTYSPVILIYNICMFTTLLGLQQRNGESCCCCFCCDTNQLAHLQMGIQPSHAIDNIVLTWHNNSDITYSSIDISDYSWG